MPRLPSTLLKGVLCRGRISRIRPHSQLKIFIDALYLYVALSSVFFSFSFALRVSMGVLSDAAAIVPRASLSPISHVKFIPVSHICNLPRVCCCASCRLCARGGISIQGKLFTSRAIIAFYVATHSCSACAKYVSDIHGIASPPTFNVRLSPLNAAAPLAGGRLAFRRASLFFGAMWRRYDTCALQDDAADGGGGRWRHVGAGIRLLARPHHAGRSNFPEGIAEASLEEKTGVECSWIAVITSLRGTC